MPQLCSARTDTRSSAEGSSLSSLPTLFSTANISRSHLQSLSSLPQCHPENRDAGGSRGLSLGAKLDILPFSVGRKLMKYPSAIALSQDKPTPGTIPPSYSQLSVSSSSSSLLSLRHVLLESPQIPSGGGVYDSDEDDSQPSPLSTFSSLSFVHEKCSRIIQELVQTEIAYQRDMQLVKLVYYDANDSPFRQSEKKRIFGNLLDILALESDIIPLLTLVTTAPQISRVFLSMMHRIDKVYCAYCVQYQDAINTLQLAETRPEVRQFLIDCQKRIQGRSTCWDLPSLLIKPVQRVLKYPLLFQEIGTSFAATPQRRDCDLLAATQGVQRVADHINEIKRRKDMVHLFVIKKRNETSIMQGFNKALKSTWQLKQKRKITAALRDQEFDRLHGQFRRQRTMAEQFRKDVVDYADAVACYCNQLTALCLALDDACDGQHSMRRKSTEQTHSKLKDLGQTFSNNTHTYVSTHIRPFLDTFEKPDALIQTRIRMLSDHQRYNTSQAKATMSTCETVHSQLMVELPRFLVLASDGFNALVGKWTRIQTEFYRQLSQHWSTMTPHLSRDKFVTKTYLSKIAPVLEELDSLFSPSRSSFSSLGASTISFGPSNADTESEYVLNQRETCQTLEVTASYPLFDGAEPAFECKALKAYQAEHPDGLCVQKGDLIHVMLPLKPDKEQWWYGRLAHSSKYGWIPAEYCQAC